MLGLQKQPLDRQPKVVNIAKWTILLVVLLTESYLGAEDPLAARESKWLAELREQIALVSPSEKRTAVAMAVSGLAEAGRDADALLIAAQESDAAAKSSLLATIAVVQARKMFFDKALATINSIADRALKEKATQYVAMELAKAGEVRRAESLAANTSEGALKEQVAAAICELLARKGEFDEAVARAEQIKDDYIKGEVIKSIARIRLAKPSPLEQLTGALHDRAKMLAAFTKDGALDSVISAIAAAQVGDRQRALQLIKESMQDLDKPEIPSRKLSTGILIAVVLVEVGENEAAGTLAEKLTDCMDRSGGGFIELGGQPILMSLLVRLDKLEAADSVLERKKQKYQADPAESSYLFALEALAESLVQFGHLQELEKRIERLKTADEKLYALTGALIGIEYARAAKR